VPFGFEDEMLEAVARGEVDAAAASPASIGWHNHGHPDRPLAIAHVYEREPGLAWDLAVGMRRSDARFRREVDRIVRAMLEDGTVARIFAAYGLEHRPPRP
jgi:ABC-type amino acid transport substrate-binding protein